MGPFVVLTALSLAFPAPEIGSDPDRGSASGRVIFEGDLTDPALKPLQADIDIFERVPLRVAVNGAKPNRIRSIPNEALIIDKQGRGVRNVIAWIGSKTVKVAPDVAKLPPLELTARNDRFSPRTFVLRVGQPLHLVSDDLEGAANFQGEFLANDAFNMLVPNGTPSKAWTPKTTEKLPLRIRNNICPWEMSWCLVLDHPHSDVTGTDGSFRLKNLPPGEHELWLWHESFGYVAKKHKITVTAGRSEVIPTIKLTVDKIAR